MGGDYNCTINVTLDRRNEKGEGVEKSDPGNTELISIMNDFDLEDSWRRRNPLKKKFTFHKKNSKSASRIDFWLFSKSLTSYILDTQFITAPITDHSGVVFKLKTSSVDRGPGFWKMNIDVMNSEEFGNVFTAFWETWEKKMVNYESKKMWWEITKVKIKELSIEVAKGRAKERNIRISLLEKSLEDSEYS